MSKNRKYSAEEVGLIHRTMMPGAKSDEVALFVSTCERTGLDPFARQIIPSSRNVQKNGAWVTVWTWIVTIDGLRKIAVDSDAYEGQEGPYWCGKDGVWKEIWTDNEPYAAKVIVHRKGFKTGLAGIAKYESYVQKRGDGKPNNVWNILGDHMVAKCAEALALRKAFPNEMAGLHTQDEMAQAGFEPQQNTQHQETMAINTKVEWSEEDYKNAAQALLTALDTMYENGVPEDVINTAQEKAKQNIGDDTIDYEKWNNRLALMVERTINKYNPKV